MSSHLTFKGVSEIGYSLLSDQLQTNLVEWFNFAFLNIGAFFNVTIPTSGVFGGNFHTLKLAKDPNWQDGQVWQGIRHHWVWESGIIYPYQPIQVSGVYIDGTFQPNSGVGPYKFHIDYPLGRAIFDSPISSASNVQMEYSYRYVQFYQADTPFFRQVQFDSFRTDSQHWNQTGSGAYDILGQNRIQLPAVVVDVTPNRRFKGLQLGEGEIVYTDVNFHLFTETPWDRGQLVDIISFQNYKNILTFDKNKVAGANKYPLNSEGSIADGGLCYKDAVESSSYFWKKIFLEEASAYEVYSAPPLYRALVKLVVRVDCPEL